MSTVKTWFLFTGFLISLGWLELGAIYFLFAIAAIPMIEGMGVVPGYVYILKAGQYYKIGVTTGAVEDRIKQLQTGSSSKISLVHTIPAWRPYRVESDLHNYYAHKHTRGEWYKLSQYDVRKLKTL